jgi:hypothetical protein
MSFLESLLGGAVLGPIGTLAGAIGVENIGGKAGQITGLYDPEERKRQERADFLRNLGREQQMGEINQMQAPQMAPQMATRIKALEDESKPVPLSQDPYYQGQRAQALQGGARELSSIQNQNRAYGVDRGGFRNIGSIQDVQDRLSSVLANVAARTQAQREQKAMTAAQLAQAHLDSQTEFNNNLHKARAAVLSGDINTAMQLMNQNEQIRQQALERQRKFVGDTLSMAAMAAGGATGNPAMASALAAKKAPVSTLDVPDYASQLQMPNFGSSLGR